MKIRKRTENTILIALFLSCSGCIQEADWRDGPSGMKYGYIDTAKGLVGWDVMTARSSEGQKRFPLILYSEEVVEASPMSISQHNHGEFYFAGLGEIYVAAPDGAIILWFPPENAFRVITEPSWPLRIFDDETYRNELITEIVEENADFIFKGEKCPE